MGGKMQERVDRKRGMVMVKIKKQHKVAVKALKTNNMTRDEGQIKESEMIFKEPLNKRSEASLQRTFFAYTLFLGPTNEDHSSGVLGRGGGYRRAYVSAEHQGWRSSATLAQTEARCPMQCRLSVWLWFGAVLA